MTALRQELEAPPEHRTLGSGWISGTISLILAIIGLGAVLCLRYPQFLTVSDARAMYNVPLIRFALHMVLIVGFLFGIVSVVLRRQKVLGGVALAMILAATTLGGSGASVRFETDSGISLGLDWFLLNLLFIGIVFIPIERWLGRREQPIFRHEWREDLLYFTISSLLVQTLSFLSLAPAMTILSYTEWTWFRETIRSQPVILQFLEIMLLTDLVQYWVHRLFHTVPFLWKFHAVHHSAQEMDWLAGSRMHVAEIVFLRGATVIPMYVLGFAESALYAYIFFVYLFSTIVHANVRLDLGLLEHFFVTPRFHHWHHGIEKEAIDVNFAVHFPLFDRLFGTYYLPANQWPSGYGIKGQMPKGFLRQLVHPFVPAKKDSEAA